jgi:hypothetical protein
MRLCDVLKGTDMNGLSQNIMTKRWVYVRCLQVLLILLPLGLKLFVVEQAVSAEELNPYSYWIRDDKRYQRRDEAFEFHLRVHWGTNREVWEVYPTLRPESTDKPIIYFRLISEEVIRDEIWVNTPDTDRSFPFALQVLDQEGNECKGLEDWKKVEIEFKPESEVKLTPTSVLKGKFKAEKFQGDIYQNGIKHQLTNFRWVPYPKTKKERLGLYLLQAKLASTERLRPDEMTSDDIARPGAALADESMNETLIIISNGIAMCKNRWYAPSKEAVLNLMSESEHTPQNIAIAIGCNEEITVLMLKTRVGPGSKAIEKAKKQAGLLLHCFESQRLIKMLTAMPKLINPAQLNASPDVVIVISSEWSFFPGPEMASSLETTLDKLSQHVNKLSVLYLMQNENDRTEEFDALVNQIGKWERGEVRQVSFDQIEDSPVSIIQNALSDAIYHPESQGEGR